MPDHHVTDTNRALYSISQVNALTGVSTPTIRKWEATFREYLKVTRTKGGQRRFHPEAVERIEFLKRLIYEEGLSLQGARKRLEQIGESNGGNAGDNPSIEKLADMVTDLLLQKLFHQGIANPEESFNRRVGGSSSEGNDAS
ncbi:MAG TPA: MerR family transcriptional regulator [Bacteroidetes bacterium]|nr:MerR family transcriptional regulator [Bacteroidota bacterium]